jgi:hypothetical protein
MEQSRKFQSGAAASPQSAASRPRVRWYGADLLEVLALSGYGIWILLGSLLGLGIYSEGRGEALVPLTLGCGFVSAGLLVACLRLSILPDWHGWRLGRDGWPTRKAMLAFTAFLPMLAVAGLVRGNNDFWATRVAGAALLVCSLVSLISTAGNEDGRRQPGAFPAAWLIGHVISACYVGGLWLWLCVVAQAGEMNQISPESWAVGLLVLAALLASVEGMLRSSSQGRREAVLKWPYSRWFVAVLVYGAPCLILLWSYLHGANILLAVVAALSCGLGKSLEQRRPGPAVH